MKRRVLAIGAAVAVAIATAVVAATAMGGGNASTILIGISAAKTGILAPYDLQAAQLFQSFQKQSAACGCAQQSTAPITTGGDEMQVAGAVVSLETFGHGKV